MREQRGYDAGSAGAERNTGSGAALYWAGKLYALTDGCKPYQLDPLSCATQKKSELGGLLTNPSDGFAAWATEDCLLYTSPSPRDLSTSRMPSSA